MGFHCNRRSALVVPLPRNTAAAIPIVSVQHFTRGSGHQAVIAAPDTINQKLPFVIDLTIAERRSMPEARGLLDSLAAIRTAIDTLLS